MEILLKMMLILLRYSTNFSPALNCSSRMLMITANLLLSMMLLFSMVFQPVASGEVKVIVNSLRANTSSGVDDIPNVVIKILGNVFNGPLVNLINEHIRSGTFPAEFKCAKVVPLHKNGGKDNPNNCRQISLLPSIPKIFERV